MEVWYDLEYDRELLIQSVAKQYGVLPSAQEELHYSEWLLLISGLMEDTPLGQVVLIRKEDDPKRIKCFTPHERKIHRKWRERTAKKLAEAAPPEEYAKAFEKYFSGMFG